MTAPPADTQLCIGRRVGPDAVEGSGARVQHRVAHCRRPQVRCSLRSYFVTQRHPAAPWSLRFTAETSSS